MARIVIQVVNGQITRVFSEESSCGVVIERVTSGEPHAHADLNFISATFEPDEVQARFVEMAHQRKHQEVEA